jgi:hypothetical protein
MAEELSPNLQEDHASNNLGTTVKICRPPHMTAIQKTAYDKSEWHIARLPKTSSKACFVQQAVTKKKCSAKIVQGNRSMADSTYTRMMVHYKKDKEGTHAVLFFATMT